MLVDLAAMVKVIVAVERRGTERRREARYGDVRLFSGCRHLVARRGGELILTISTMVACGGGRGRSREGRLWLLKFVGCCS